MNIRLLATALTAAAALVACGAQEPEPASAPGDGDPPAAGMCAPDQPDCVDTVAPGDDGAAAGGTCLAGAEDCADDPSADGDDAFPSDLARNAAQELLGTSEAELPDDVRVARRGDEQFMLTEDYVLGRMTVELDAADGGAFVVTAVTVELPDGPETFTA